MCLTQKEIKILCKSKNLHRSTHKKSEYSFHPIYLFIMKIINTDCHMVQKSVPKMYKV